MKTNLSGILDPGEHATIFNEKATVLAAEGRIYLEDIESYPCPHGDLNGVLRMAT